MKKISEIHKLFIRKEGKELLGKHGSNFIILTVIFIISLLSMAFARSSRVYLQERMEDPFVKWMDIVVNQKLDEGDMSLIEFLKDKGIQESCSFGDPIAVYTQAMYFYTKNKETEIQFLGRSLDVNTSIFSKILSSRNVLVKRKGSFSNDSIGIIVSHSLISELGFSLDSIPDYLYLSQVVKKEKCPILHYQLICGRIPVAIPVIAVVKEIPGVEYSFMFTKGFYDVIYDHRLWNVLEKAHNTSLNLYGRRDVLDRVADNLRKRYEDSICINSFSQDYESWNREVGFIEIVHYYLHDTAEAVFYNDIYYALVDSGVDITRIYNFQPEKSYTEKKPTMYSIEIQNLKNVRTLQKTIKDKCNKRLDMRSVESQENFYYVEFMSNILAWSIIVIAVVFIFVLIYFMLFTHFQKIQKNIGTFKAFGFSNKTLYGIYLVLIIGNVLAAFAISLCTLAIVQFILQLLNVGMMYEGILFPYFDVFISYTAYLLMIVIAVAVLSTIIVAYKKLHHTPGDLIYNRNQQ